MRTNIHYLKKDNASLKSKIDFMNEKFTESMQKQSQLELKKKEIDQIKKLLLKLDG